jgi:hypothetical protein
MYYGKKQPAPAPTVESLTAELEKCEKLQEVMKAVNAYWRAHKTCVGAPGITNEQAEKLDYNIATATRSWERRPYSTYDITNNNSKIKRLRESLDEVSRGFSGWEFAGGRSEANAELNRLQLFFNVKPDKQQCAVLKANGFKWAPSQSAWQRQLTDNAIYSAGRIDFIKPLDGRSVREHQPKPPACDSAA